MTQAVELRESKTRAEKVQASTNLRPAVTPVMHPSISRFLKQKELVFALLDGMGSPLNLMFPRHILETISGFERVIKERQLQGRIFYTSKPNKSVSLKRQASVTNVGLDVSSYGELKTALSAGFHPSRVEATGPKNVDYLTLGIQQDIIIAVDNFTELRQIVALKHYAPSHKPRVLIRLNGFDSGPIKFTAQDGILGFPVEDAPSVIDYLVEHQADLDFQGFSFNFYAGDYNRRPAAIETILKFTFECLNRGLTPKAVNIGGGYVLRYAAERDEWNTYIQELKASVLGERPSLTWNDSGLGFRRENGVLKGAPTFLEHYHETSGHEDLAAIIDAPLAAFDGYSTARMLSENMLELWVEPGRAMVDQCGVTIARVNLSKSSMMGHQLVALDMNRSNLNSNQLQLMTDPVVIYGGTDRKPATEGVMYVGNLCLSHDMIQYHKTFPDFVPETGDAVAFINTAAYQMDFSETNVLRQRVAEKVAIVETAPGVFRWFADELYNPIALEMEKM
jgi:diaminopimelate decarboxylase